MKPGATVAWLSSEQAAIHLGYVRADGSPNLGAFLMWKHRARPRAYRLRGRLRFRQADLDRCLELETVRPLHRRAHLKKGGGR